MANSLTYWALLRAALVAVIVLTGLIVLLTLPAWALTVTPTTNIESDKAAYSAAVLGVQVCQGGISGQAVGGGFAIIDSDAFCDEIRLSDVMLLAAQREESAGRSGELYRTQYAQALDRANSLISDSATLAVLDRWARALLIPLGVMAGLLLF